MEGESVGTEESPLSWAAARVGDRWSLLVVGALLPGPRRFGELADAMPDIATNVLSHRLKRLEAEGILTAVAYSTRPARYRYELTPLGRDLGGVLRLLAQWGAAAGGANPGHDTLAHTACGTTLEARWWCPTCEQAVTDADADDLRFL